MLHTQCYYLLVLTHPSIGLGFSLVTGIPSHRVAFPRFSHFRSAAQQALPVGHHAVQYASWPFMSAGVTQNGPGLLVSVHTRIPHRSTIFGSEFEYEFEFD